MSRGAHILTTAAEKALRRNTAVRWSLLNAWPISPLHLYVIGFLWTGIQIDFLEAVHFFLPKDRIPYFFTEFPTSSLISASVRECPVQQDLSLCLGTVVMKTRV